MQCINWVLIVLIAALYVNPCNAVSLQPLKPKLDKPHYLQGNTSFNRTATSIKLNNYRLQIYKQCGHNKPGWIGVKYRPFENNVIVRIFAGSYMLHTCVRPGDRLLAINGQPVALYPLYIARPGYMAGDIEMVTILHIANGIVYDLPIVLIPLDSRYQPFYHS